ncbi:MAG: hypothetical protein ABL890_02430 [Candidatus Peribacteraceae bacterium]
MNLSAFLPSSLSVFFSADDPVIFALQVAAVCASVIVVYSVLFVTRDVILRSQSVLFQVFSILVTAALPVAGFFLYLLMRPATTNADRALRKDITEMLVRLRAQSPVASTPVQTSEKKEKIEKFVKKSILKNMPAETKTQEPALTL